MKLLCGSFSGGKVLNIMDAMFNGMGGSEFYRSQVFPELFPHEKPMIIDNWTAEEREMYCGVYAD